MLKVLKVSVQHGGLIKMETLMSLVTQLSVFIKSCVSIFIEFAPAYLINKRHLNFGLQTEP